MTDDPRVTCTACANYRAGRCVRALAAGLSMNPKRPAAEVEIGRQFATLPQNCSAHSPRKGAPHATTAR